MSRDGLFKILAKIGCPPTLLSIMKSFHDNMKRTIVYDGATSDPFNNFSGLKQGCILAHTLFGIFFATLLKHAVGKSTESIYLRTRSDGNLFKLSRLRAKARVHEKYVRDLDNACTPREKVECVSHALPQTYSGNHIAGQGDK